MDIKRPYRTKRITYLRVFFVWGVLLLISGYFAATFSAKSQLPKVPSEEILPPKIIPPSGFYQRRLKISIENPDSTRRIYYSFGGSNPISVGLPFQSDFFVTQAQLPASILSDIPSSPRWQQPLFKERALIVRAASSSDKGESNVVSKIYFLRERKSDFNYSLPVLSVITDNRDLFDFTFGVYVMGRQYGDKDLYAKKKIGLDLPWWEYPANYRKRGKNAERMVSVEYFENEKLAFAGNAGFRITGNATRAYSQKSFRLFFRNKLNFPFFQSDSTISLNTLVVRNSGNDWHSTMMRDALMQSLLRETGLDIQYYKPVIVFLNGEYWGVYQVSERMDETLLSARHKIGKDNIAIYGTAEGVFHGNDADGKAYKDMVAFFKTADMKNDSVFAEASSLIDLENFTTYAAAEIFYANTDWPANNVRLWRYRRDSVLTDSAGKMNDGRWRFLVGDLDYGYGYIGLDLAVGYDLFKKATTDGEFALIFSGLLKNEKFKKYFKQKFNAMLSSTFSTERALKEIDRMQTVLAPEMEKQIGRWRVPYSVGKWKDNVEALREFARRRPAVVKAQLEKL